MKWNLSQEGAVARCRCEVSATNVIDDPENIFARCDVFSEPSRCLRTRQIYGDENPGNERGWWRAIAITDQPLALSISALASPIPFEVPVTTMHRFRRPSLSK
jgi:hypothetical protein